MSKVGAMPPPEQDFPDNGGLHHVDQSIWAPLRRRWIDASSKPEEFVRQEWIRRLAVSGGFTLPQMDQERRTQHGRRSPRADIVVWATVTEKSAGRSPVLVVETKADEGPARPEDFWQGESYARASGARFLIIATASMHAVFEVIPGAPGSLREINDWPKAADVTDSARLLKLVSRQRTFDRDEFQRLLFECHSLLRDAHAMTPDRAFDTMSKVLFIKLHVERTQTHETFTTDYLDKWTAMQLRRTSSVHDLLFDDTKDAYAVDDLFDTTDKLDISEATFRQLVSKLERFNLSKTGDDVKGIAFEKFLGRTFRGELGQFFTPRPVVDFMIRALNPLEGEVLCDPAAGSGGFLIAAFDHVRSAIATDLEAKRKEAIETISSEYPDDASEALLKKRDALIDRAVRAINRELMPTDESGENIDTRVGHLAWRCIYGTDKEPRAARTAKMNMIMHGDGHGGIHWHDGLVDVNGIFNGRFDVVVTNPPFGATVNQQQRVGDTRESDVEDGAAYHLKQKERFGDAWEASYSAVKAARGQSILNLYEIGRGQNSRQTETLFVERCLNLLQPGGRMAIILPNGNLNAASLNWLRRWTEGKAFLRGIVALPPETFKFSRASVSASVVFLQKFDEEDASQWERAWELAATASEKEFDARRTAAAQRWQQQSIDGGNEQLRQVLQELASHGINRNLPVWKRSPSEGLVRGAGSTRIGTPVWTGTASTRVLPLVRELKARYTTLAATVPALKAALADLRTELRAIDGEHTAAMWKTVRATFDYSVFMASPNTVGITSTGDTGDHVSNELPDVLTEWQKFTAGIPGWPA